MNRTEPFPSPTPGEPGEAGKDHARPQPVVRSCVPGEQPATDERPADQKGDWRARDLRLVDDGAAGDPKSANSGQETQHTERDQPCVHVRSHDTSPGGPAGDDTWRHAALGHAIILGLMRVGMVVSSCSTPSGCLLVAVVPLRGPPRKPSDNVGPSRQPLVSPPAGRGIPGAGPVCGSSASLGSGPSTPSMLPAAPGRRQPGGRSLRVRLPGSPSASPRGGRRKRLRR